MAAAAAATGGKRSTDKGEEAKGDEIGERAKADACRDAKGELDLGTANGISTFSTWAVRLASGV